jgi:hypothetical protein
MNRLSLTRRTQIINCLVEGSSIRSTERMTDTHRDTVMRLGVEVGTACEKKMPANWITRRWKQMRRPQGARFRQPYDDETQGGLPTAPPVVRKHHGLAAHHATGRRTLARQRDQVGPRFSMLGKPP